MDSFALVGMLQKESCLDCYEADQEYFIFPSVSSFSITCKRSFFYQGSGDAFAHEVVHGYFSDFFASSFNGLYFSYALLKLYSTCPEKQLNQQ